MEQFFDREKMDTVVTKSIADLTHPIGIDQHLPFTARRGKALLAHTMAVANLIGEKTKQLYSGQAINHDCLVARVARIETIVDPDFTRSRPALVEDEITQCRARLDRMQQQMSALTKQVSALVRKTNL